MMFKLCIAFLCVAIVVSDSELLQRGDFCGVLGKDFLNENFTGSVAVAGDGCVSGNNTNCLCAPNFDDGQSLSGFVWQCNGDVKFGPKNGKVCPPKVPVVKSMGIDSIDFSESLLGVPVPCNTSIHPGGRPGDEVCGYSECETGGSFSAICGCVDLGQRDEVDSVGSQWICLHSTCGCKLDDDSPTDAQVWHIMPPVSSPTRDTATTATSNTTNTSASPSIPFIYAAVAICAVFAIVGF